MYEHDPTQPEPYPPIVIGQRLPGLMLAGELPSGMAYDEQVIPTAYGDLKYFSVQGRSGHITWATDPKPDENLVFCVAVSGDGIVLSTNEEDLLEERRQSQP